MAIYDTMQSLKSPVGTHCVGYAYNLAAFLLAAGEKVSFFPFLNPGNKSIMNLVGHISFLVCYFASFFFFFSFASEVRKLIPLRVLWKLTI